MTNAWIDWFHIFITQVNTNNIVMWEILPNNADWDCFRTLTLREILRIQNLRQVEHCTFLEVIHLFQSVGCVRNELQFRTVQQNQKSFLWMQDWGWMVYPHCIYGIWSSRFFTETRIRIIMYGETRINLQREQKFMERLMIWTMLILLPETWILLVRKLCCTSLKTTKQWSRWS